MDKNQGAFKARFIPLNLILEDLNMKKRLLSILGASAMVFAVNAQPTQVVNGGFENWENLQGPISNTYDEPVDWSSSNECTAIVNQFSVIQSADAHSGSSSVMLETKATSFQGVIANGIVTTGNMICLAQGGGQEGGSDFHAYGGTTRSFPDSIIGWYKYAPVDMDSAYAQIMWLRNNDDDTLCYTRIDFHAQATWKRFSVAFCPGDVNQPEKLSMLFSSSWGDGSLGEAVVGSVLHIDDLEFYYPSDVSIGDELESINWSVYPNPVAGELNIQVAQGQEANIEVLDVTGKRVKFSRVSDEKSTLDLSTLVSGIYLFQIKSLENEVLRTGKLLVNP